MWLLGIHKVNIDDAQLQRATDIGRSQKLSLSALCSGELKIRPTPLKVTFNSSIMSFNTHKIRNKHPSKTKVQIEAETCHNNLHICKKNRAG